MSRMRPIDDIAPEGGVEKALKQTMTCKVVHHARRHVRTNSDTLCNCECKRAKYACDHKIRRNSQGTITLIGPHATICFKKDTAQGALDAKEEIKSMVDDAHIEDLSWSKENL